MKKSRFFYLYDYTNKGKFDALNKLQIANALYIRECLEILIKTRRINVHITEIKNLFKISNLLSETQSIARNNAATVIKTWAVKKYKTKLKNYIYKLFKNNKIDEPTLIKLYCIGKYSIDKLENIKNNSKMQIEQIHIDMYLDLLFDEDICGKTPTISDNFPITLTVNACTFSNTKKYKSKKSVKISNWWISITSLVADKRIHIPLKSNPYITSRDQLVNGILARKDKLGNWRFEIIEKQDYDVIKQKDDLKIGIDVGLNCLAATSDGRIYGQNFKHELFSDLNNKIKYIRSERQKQNLPRNSKRLQVLEHKLTARINNIIGMIANKLIKDYPEHKFILENLDLKGTKGQKRFAYNALINKLISKVETELVNPAYTSQTCPSCNYVNRNNRNGTNFCCLSCNRESHADIVGAINILGRSEDKNINGVDNIASLKLLLEQQYLDKRNHGNNRVTMKLDAKNSSPKKSKISDRKRHKPLSVARAAIVRPKDSAMLEEHDVDLNSTLM